MGSKNESLNKRIRETISSLSDEDLAQMQQASPQNYTPFARRVLEQELSRRRRIKASVTDSSRNRNVNSALLQAEHAGTKHADCYIEIWSLKNFEGEHLRIEGPGEYQTLQVSSFNWGSHISSLRVGPCAFVLVYAETEFKGTMMSFGPGQEVPNLEELNFNDEIDSIKVVNSIKVFDGFRAEEAAKPAAASPPEKKRNKVRRKIRGG